MLSRAPSGSDSAGPPAATPMMAQYLAIKRENPDGLLFYRMGDFYELFFADAEVAAKALSITLTQRGTHLGEPIKMAGVPVQSADEYLHRLIEKGFRVVVAEQVEDPAEAKKRGAKAVVAREVVRIVTPGTLTEERLLDPGRPSVLLAIAPSKGRVGLAAVDLASGRFTLADVARESLVQEVARIDPAEIVAPEGEDLPAFTGTAALARRPVGAFAAKGARERIAAHYGIADLAAFGSLTDTEAAAAGAVLDYLAHTQLGADVTLDAPTRSPPGETMAIDAATRASLELTHPFRADGPTLLSTIDRTVSGMGAQRLAERIASPSTVLAEIGARHDAVAALATDHSARRAIRTALKGAGDVRRAVGRLAMGRGRPRDLMSLSKGLSAAAAAWAALPAEPTALLSDIAKTLSAAPLPIGERLAATLEERAASANDPDGVVSPGVDPALDEARTLRDESRKVIAALQATYQSETGVKALKIKHNAVLGWFVEVPAAHGDTLRSGFAFTHRQSLASAVRFTTDSLRDLESRILGASEDARAREALILEELTAAAVAARPTLAAIADAMAELDVAAAFAEIAVEGRWTRPSLSATHAFRIAQGRHPVVEAALSGARAFVPNDCALGPLEGDGAARATILTGPNMGGKSTYLRQNALIAVLAQAGSFVPAARAEIGIVDRLFSRIGAADDLASGRSTFMVEMIELAAILHQAGPGSLVVLDEIGRGTATFDGLSIAWAAMERLNELGCRTLFATHYHELTALAERRPRIDVATMAVKEWRGDIVFLHEVGPGAADRSYGVQVARLAGLPPAVIARAKDVLTRLEESDRSIARDALASDLPLFTAAADPAVAAPSPPKALAVLDEIEPDSLSPREALELVYTLKAARRRDLGET